MKHFLALLMCAVIAFAITGPASGSNLPPPVKITVSECQPQLDQVAVINNVEQTFIYSYQSNPVAAQVRAVLPEESITGESPVPPDISALNSYYTYNYCNRWLISTIPISARDWVFLTCQPPNQDPYNLNGYIVV